jgi:hypothetical protein
VVLQLVICPYASKTILGIVKAAPKANNPLLPQLENVGVAILLLACPKAKVLEFKDKPALAV